MISALNRIFLACLLMSLSTFAVSANLATKEEAINLVKAAISTYKAEGKEKALAAISDPKGKFRDRELFVVVLDSSGTVIAHSVLKKMISANLMQFRDSDGVYMIKDMMEKAKKDHSGWSVEYKFLNPDTQKMEPKLSYFEKHEDLLFFCGIYKQ